MTTRTATTSYVRGLTCYASPQRRRRRVRIAQALLQQARAAANDLDARGAFHQRGPLGQGLLQVVPAAVRLVKAVERISHAGRITRSARKR